VSHDLDDLYRPPSATPEQGVVRLRGYQSPQTLALIASALVGLSGILSLIVLGSRLVSAPEMAALVMTIVSPLCVLVAGIAFLAWVHRLHSNISALGKRTTVTPGSAVIHYFIPFLNLVRPYEHMMVAWRLSAPRKSERDTPSPILLWWCMWIGQAVLGAVVGLTTANVSFVDGAPANAGHMVLDLANMATAAVCIRMILLLSERQDAAAKRRARQKRKRAARESSALEKLFGEP